MSVQVSGGFAGRGAFAGLLRHLLVAGFGPTPTMSAAGSWAGMSGAEFSPASNHRAQATRLDGFAGAVGVADHQNPRPQAQQLPGHQEQAKREQEQHLEAEDGDANEKSEEHGKQEEQDEQ